MLPSARARPGRQAARVAVWRRVPSLPANSPGLYSADQAIEIGQMRLRAKGTGIGPEGSDMRTRPAGALRWKRLPIRCWAILGEAMAE